MTTLRRVELDFEPAQAALLDKMSEEVAVSGTLVEKGGAQMIYTRR